MDIHLIKVKICCNLSLEQTFDEYPYDQLKFFTYHILIDDHSSKSLLFLN